ncbi:MAG TPA: hypothetical protein VGC16_05305 [Rhizomicrobium sp.]
MPIFEVFCDRRGCWHARRSDGLVEGLFAARQDAIRFARRESALPPVLRG